MVYCYVPFCRSQCQNSEKRTPNVSFHEFPCHDDIRKQWIRNIARNDKNGELRVPADRSRVCSLHFDADDFMTGLKLRRLRKDAVPTIFPGYPSYMQPKPRKLRLPRKKPVCVPAPKPPKTTTKVAAGVDTECSSPRLTETVGTTSAVLEMRWSHAGENEQNCTGVIEEGNSCLGDKANVQKPTVRLRPFTPKPWITKPGRQKKPKQLEILTKDVGTSLRPKTAEIAVQVSVVAKVSPQHQKKLRRLACRNSRLVKANTRLRLEVINLKQQLGNPLLKTVETIERGVEGNDIKALFIKELSIAYAQKRHKWSDAIMRHCMLWHFQSPKSYNFIRSRRYLDLPSLATLRRYNPDGVMPDPFMNNNLVSYVVKEESETTDTSEDSNLGNADAGPHQMTVVLAIQ